jgi:predicted ATPase
VLKTLRIERFKSIYEQDISFGKVNLFVGPNGAGKSNILEALGVLSAALSSGLEPHTLDMKGVRLSLPHLFKSAFKKHVLPKTFRLEAQFENGRYDCSIRAGAQSSFLEFFSEALYDGDHQVFGRSSHGTKLHSAAKDVPSFSKDLVASTRSIWSVIDPIVKISPGLRSELDEFSRFAIYAPQTAVMRGMAVDQRVVEPLGLTGSGLAAAFDTILKDKSIENLENILRVIWEPGWADQIKIWTFDPAVVPSQVRSEGLILYIRDKYMRAGRNMLSAFDASEGTLYLVFVAALLAHRLTPKTFALDNVDGTLNPRLVRRLSKHLVDVVVRTTEDSSRQAFITSHHPSSLDSFDIFDDQQKIFVCRRRSDDQARVIGQSTYTPLLPPKNTTKEDWVLKHRGKNLSELLLTNRIPDAL